MGMRRNIALQYQGEPKTKDEDSNVIYLYTHWDAEGLEDTLAHTLDRARSRWDDESYLARIIFTDVTARVGDELTGYGLAPYEIDPEFPTLWVNLKEQTVNGVPYEDFISNPEQFSAWSNDE